ncbi:MAG: hemerythrin domain-containing protein [Candidatus Jettenia sp. CY-1]|nr:MAG: hemerythrin domain-containing protein [Candidatus Jettenia sp. CY-1]
MKKIFIIIVLIPCTYLSPYISSAYSAYQHNTSAVDQSLLATEMLHQEFETIRRVLHILEKASHCLDKGEPVSQKTFSNIIEIIKEFSDKCHQEKEDKVLFPLMKDKEEGKKKDLLGRLLMEHVTSRDKIRDLSVSLNNLYLGKKAKKKLTKIAYAYIKHTRKHIQTEEKVLFPWVNKVLTHDEQILLKNKFEALEKNDIETGIHEKYITMIEEIEKQLEICPEF